MGAERNGLPAPGSAAAPPNSPIGMWSGPGPTFCTAASCRFFVMSQYTRSADGYSMGESLGRIDELSAGLHQRAVAAGRGEQRQKRQNRERKQHDIQSKGLHHQVGAE